MPVAVLLSGSGRTLENFLRERDAGRLPADIVAVVSSRDDARGVDIARRAGCPVGVFRRKDHPDIAAHNAAINEWLAPRGPGLILLAGYLCYYQRPGWFDGPILNIHPALLPRHGGKGLYGRHVHEAVLAAGETESGCTVHHVNDVYDAGEIVAQQRVPVLPGDTPDTLAARVFTAECALYPRVVEEIARSLLEQRSG
ncbi:phosphoribosylglycinamide formyltransferase [bacterium]|nr:phosphoribosylglycinamide formyltransferase [bacterium]MBU1676017.1 phosphoribosylglycinamide formyltransferase [bacterium]